MDTNSDIVNKTATMNFGLSMLMCFSSFKRGINCWHCKVKLRGIVREAHEFNAGVALLVAGAPLRSPQQ
jgi:hypothetical protein